MLKAGDKAPKFELESDAGKTIKLSDFAGKTLVLYFYPKDSTPGCTREAIGFSGAADRIKKLGASVVGVSKDSVKSHGSFRDKYDLAIPLLSDPDLKVHKAYGAFGEKMMYGKKVEGTIRSTFIVGPDGKLTKVFPNVKVDGHVDQVLGILGGGDAKATPAKKKTAVAKKKAPAKKKVAKKKA
jgi:peroxiredoxin Q/BCP